jgi:hypothetical protein
MAKIQSQSERSSGEAKSFFVPTFAGSIIFFILGMLLLVAYNSSQIISWVGSSYLESADKLNLNINILNNGLSNSFSTAFDGRLGQIVVWSLVGALAYMGLWFLKNLLNSFENDVIINHYLHPANFNRAGYWGSALAGKIFFAATAIILVTYTYMALKVVMPAAAALTSSAVNNFELAKSLLYVLLCVLISAGLIYIWTLIARTTAHLWKLL